MGRYLVLRLLRSLLTLLILVSLAFVVLRLSGDPARIILGPEADPQSIADLRARWGLDQPFYVQYVSYLWAALHGDLGRSFVHGIGAMDLVLERLPLTLALTIPALFLKIIIGIPCGIVAAVYRDTIVDRAIMAFSVVGFATPNFVLGLILVFIFSVQLGWLPSGGSASLQSAILPIATIGIVGAAAIARFTRSAMLEVLGQPYIRTASAKGLEWRDVVRSHALPNAAIPTVTLIGFLVGNLTVGALITESVFSWPGLGRLLVSSVANRDLAVVQCILLLVGVTMITANFIVDMLYGWLDPRISVATESGAQ